MGIRWTRYSVVLISMMLCQSAPAQPEKQAEKTVTADSAPDAAPDAAAIEFFETSVRPLLISACGDCHGAKKQWGGLRVDSRGALLKGGDTEPAVVPGKPEESLLMTSVRRIGDYDMPPENPLNANQIAILERWIAMGAPWPVETAHGETGNPEDHWAFQPISKAAPPSVATAPDWCRTPVDAFILSKLEAAQLSPSPPADRRTLIRRVFYTLTGLPPSPEEVEEFVQDADPLAYEKLVNRLLESPQYGEHWARHWLDLARYADTKGYMFGWEPNRFLHSATYRDWVVKAFQQDLPYDEFLLLQIAADQAAPDDAVAQGAMGFLTIGRRFLGNDHDIIDDRIDVVGRTTMGLTFGCARCHDHKYDPIPITDYYSLYGVFGNSTEELVPSSPPTERGSEAFRAELEKRVAQLDEKFQEYRNKISDRMRDRITDYLIAQSSLESYPDIPFSQIIAENDLFPVYLHRLDSFLRRMKEAGNPIFIPWHRYAAIPEEEFAQRAADVTEELARLGPEQVSPAVAAHFTVPPASMNEVAERYGALFTEVTRDWRTLNEQAVQAGTPAPTALPDPQREALRQVLYGDDSPCLVPNESLTGIGTFFATRSELEDIWKYQKAIEQWISDSPDAPAFAVRMIDKTLIDEPRVFRRGNPATKGNEVPRRFPLIVAGPDSPPFLKGSGRLELAQGIVSPDNPLTPRVWVNRIWQFHFGTGLVPTPSDFGVRAPEPAQLALLDWLATTLIEKNWSTKEIHRLILLSSTFQQAATGPEDLTVRRQAEEQDPENHLLWKKGVHRLTFEEFRDSLLKVSGDLDLTVGGRSSTLFSGGDSNRRRTLYGFIDRQSLPGPYSVFDFANPDLHIPVRSETTVSQQALFALNHPFVATRASELAAQITALQNATPAEQIQMLFRRIFQRPPTPRQLEMSLQFLEGAETQAQPQLTPEQLAWQYGTGAINDDAKAVLNFQPLPYFTGSSWQGGASFPDPTLGWAQLTAAGGHPGNDHNHAAVRRWTAPRSGTISIESLATHEPTEGNGIRCWIFSSRHGVLNRFLLHHSSQKISLPSLAVETGDTLDFVVDIHGSLGFDQYLWNVAIQDVGALAGTAEGGPAEKEWDSTRDFVGPATGMLTPWQQLVQVLLLSNEFLFVD